MIRKTSENALYLSVALVAALFSSCGPFKSSSEEHVRDYKFFVSSPELMNELGPKIANVLQKLNDTVGQNVFSLTSDPSTANSNLSLADLSPRFGSDSIGAGSSHYKVIHTRSVFDLSKSSVVSEESKYIHGMDVEIDESWFKTWVQELKNKCGDGFSHSLAFPLSAPLYGNCQRDEMKYFDTMFEILLLHEIGHGLGLDHTEDHTSVMHPTIDTSRDVAQFLKVVANIFASDS